MPRRYPDLLLADMLDCIVAIETYTLGMSAEQLMASPLHQDAVIRNLEVIGEAANQLPDFVHDMCPEIPWPRLISLRNRLIHEYHGVNWDLLLPAILEQLPILKTRLESLKSQVPQIWDKP